MPRFKFRFEKILAYRGHQEKQKQRELAKVRALEQEQSDRILGISEDRIATQKQEKNFLTGKLDPLRLTGYSRYYLKLKQMEITGREVLQQIAAEVEKKRQALVEATKQKKIYEKLKERYRERHDREYNLALQKENDEIGQQIFLRHH
jgi:flagellar FliJ protein